MVECQASMAGMLGDIFRAREPPSSHLVKAFFLHELGRVLLGSVGVSLVTLLLSIFRRTPGTFLPPRGILPYMPPFLQVISWLQTTEMGEHIEPWFPVTSF